ncbi:MAG: hydantoinase B/oxoprolinase family protein [Burkholderiales bacterium]
MNKPASANHASDSDKSVAATPSIASLNPITAEMIRHALLAIPNQIDLNITRTAFSPIIYVYKDFACGIVDPEGRLICQGKGSIPLFVANALGVAVRDGLEVHGRDGIEPGDVIFTNDPGSLGQHLNNVAMYTPIFSEGNEPELLGFMAVLVHWIDIGGMVVGSAATSKSTDIFQEGIQFRSVKLWSRGKPVKDVYRIIESNTRFPRMLMGDVQSQLAGCLLGKDMFLDVVKKYGLQTVRSSIDLMWERSEAAARRAIAAIPDGTYSASSFLDSDSIDVDKHIEVNVEVRVHGDEMTVDFSRVSDQVKGPLNSGREGGAVTAARIAFKYLVAPDEPANDGSFRPLHIVIPEGKFISAKGSAPMGGYSTPIPTVVDTVIKCLVTGMPDYVAGGHHGNFGIHGYSGISPITKQLFHCNSTMHGGWGASKGHDGPGPYKTMAHGDTLDIPVEMQEALYPIRIESQSLRIDSGGAGEFRGGLGVEKVSHFLAPCNSHTSSDRNGCAPWGILGGKDGAVPDVEVERASTSGKKRESARKTTVPLVRGDSMIITSGGGGGYGDPLLRDPSRVERDVRLGYVSREAALADYGVVLDAKGAAMDKETRSERQRRKSSSR